MKRVTVSKTFQQALSASFPGPPALGRAVPANSFGPSRPELGPALNCELPSPYHTRKPHRKSVSLPSYLCLLATLLFMPSPCLIPFLPAVSRFCQLLSGGFEKQLQASEESGGGGVGGGGCRGVGLCQGQRSLTWLMGHLNSVLTLFPWHMVEPMALIFFSLPSSWGSSFPLLHSPAFLPVNIL